MAEEEMEAEHRAEMPGRKLSWFERKTGFKLRHVLAATAGVVLLGLYIGNLFFGDASYAVLRHLNTYEAQLRSEILRLKKENARLQKEYFELKELAPQE